MWSAMVFLFFLTYGFIGLELVAMNLSTPFGDGPNDIRVSALRDAVFDGIERDLAVVPDTASRIAGNSSMSITNRRSRFARQRETNAVIGTMGSNDHHDDYQSSNVYHDLA